MTWRLLAHHGLRRELSKLSAKDAQTVTAALRGLAAHFDRLPSLNPRLTFSSGSLAPVPDLQPLRGTDVPGSYRLRVGRFRVALALLPDEEIILATAASRRDDSTYDDMPALHRRRFHDR